MFLVLFLALFTNCKINAHTLAEYDYEKDGPWYKSQLTKYQKPFYEALEYWRENNLLTDAPTMYLESDSNLDHKVEENLLKLYVSGRSNAINTHFLSAVAAWRFDHPEIFYVDVSKLMFRISQDENRKFKCLFGCISNPSLLHDYIKKDKISEMIATLNSKVSEMIAEAKSDNRTENIIAVHNYLKNKIKYRRQYQIPDNESQYRDYVYDPYGALVNNRSVCDGFSKSFQIAMNELHIPSVQVPGDALDENGNAQSHSWNVVQLEDKVWYLVDVTYDTTGGVDTWLLANQLFTASTHFPNGQLDSNPVTFYFPPAPLPMSDKWSFAFDYTNEGILRNIYFGFENKNYTAILADNYRYATKYYRFKRELGVIQEDPWLDLRQQWLTMFSPDGVDYNQSLAQHIIDESVIYVQYAVTNKDVEFFYTPDQNPNIQGVKPHGVNDSEVLFKSPLILNNNSNVENISMYSNMVSPSVQYFSPTPRHFFPGYEYSFVFSMTEELVSSFLSDEGNQYSNFSISLTAVSNNHYDRNNGKAEKIGEDAVKMTIVRDVAIINNKTIAATIKPSNSYAHDYMDYTVHFHGLVGAYSQKEVDPFTFTVRFFPNNGGTNTCSKMMGQGTVYVAGRPVLISDGDIRNGGLNDDFNATDSNGKVVPGKGATSSDIALVATRKDDGDYEPYTATFDLSLSLYCRAYFIKPGQWNCPLTIQLPFPDGFDPNENKDVSFEVIHYKDDGSVLETNTVVVGATGLLITVQSFSPFKIKPKDKSASILAPEDVQYPLYTSTVGGSPTITLKTSDGDKKITNIVASYKIGQTLSIETPADSRVERIYLNGKEFEISSYKSFTLPADLLNERSNNLEVYLVQLSILEKEYDQKLSVFHITADVAAKSQTKEAKELDDVLTLSAGSPQSPPGLDSDPNNEFKVEDEKNDPDNYEIPEKDLPPEDELPDMHEPVKPPENPDVPLPPVVIIKPEGPGTENTGNSVEPVTSTESDGGNENDGNDGNGNGGAKGDGNKLPTGAIVGIVVGIVVVIAVVILLVYFLVIRPKKLRESSDKVENDISNAKESPAEASTGL